MQLDIEKESKERYTKDRTMEYGAVRGKFLRSWPARHSCANHNQCAGGDVYQEPPQPMPDLILDEDDGIVFVQREGWPSVEVLDDVSG